MTELHKYVFGFQVLIAKFNNHTWVLNLFFFNYIINISVISLDAHALAQW